jgi:chorismate synthase
MNNSFGHLFKITTFGESHGPCVGVVIDGLPGNLEIDLRVVQGWLNRRKPGQSNITSPREESDIVECLSGLEGNRTLGGPLTLIVRNKNMNPDDYQDVAKVYRPGHADWTAQLKFGIAAQSGGGRFSARETIGRVAAGAIAWQMLQKQMPALECLAWVQSVADIHCPPLQEETLNTQIIDQSEVRCPDQKTAQRMREKILEVKSQGDSVGGVIRCVIKGVPAGLGAPVFDKLEADLAKAMMSLPATKGFEIGSGFAGTRLKGSEHNDAIIPRDGKITTKTNRAGGILGGISNGEIITFNVAFKPVSTIFKPQETVDKDGQPIEFKPNLGRHDPCVLPRAVPIVEAMALLVIADHWLRQKALSNFIEI